MKALLFANTDWYLYNFRLPLARALRQQGVDVVLVSPPGDYADRLMAAGFRWLSFPLARRGMNPVAELGTVLHLFRLYRRENPELVHHFTVKCVLYGSLAARLVRVKAIVNSVIGLGYLYTEGRGLKAFLRLLVQFSYRHILKRTQVIFQNEDDQSAFVRAKLVRIDSAHLIRGSGVDISTYVPSPEPDGVPVVMLAARMLWDKGVGEFVEAADRLRVWGVAAQFILVGDTDAANPSAIPAEQLDAWQRSGLVAWWGWRDDMATILPQANIVCLPSYYREGLPKSLIEAAACGRAIVTTDVPGCREAVSQGVNGFLVPARDVDALAQALRTLIEQPDLRREMGREGRKIAEEQFTVERVVSETLRVYDEACMKG